MQADAGESTAALTKRQDDSAWPRIEAHLRAGCTLHRPPKLRTYYPHNGVDYIGGTGGISAARLRRLERDGVLVHVGVDRYALNDGAS